MTPTTEQLKDLLNDHENSVMDMLRTHVPATCALHSLAPTLAAEVVRLREALEEIALQDQFHCRRNGEIVPDWGLCGQIARQALDATSAK